MSTRPTAAGLQLWLAMATIYVVWGSTYLGIAIAIESLPPFLMAAIRFAIAGVLLLGWAAIRNGGRFERPSGRELRDSAIVGALLLGIGNGFVAFGEQTVASGIAAILIATIPVSLAVFGWLYFRERLPRIAIFGVAIGMVGVAVLLWPGGAGANAFDPLGVALLLLANVGWAHGTLFSAHRAQLPRSPLVASGLQMLAGALVLTVEGLVTGELGQLHPETVTLRSLVAVGYLVVFGSMVAYTAYAWLLRHAPLSLVGTYAYVNPIVAVALGALFLSEPISPRTLIAAAGIVAAVAMVVTARSRMAGPTEQPAAEGAEEAPSPSVRAYAARGGSLSSRATRGAPSD